MQRLLTGLALIAVGLYLIFLAPNSVFLGAAVLMSLLCYREFAGLVAAHGISKPNLVGVAVGLVLLFDPRLTLPGLALGGMLACIVAIRLRDLRQLLPHVSATVYGGAAMFIPWRFATDLRQVSVHLLFFALASNWVGDSAAYYTGKRFGRNRLAPSISPNKSWEGAAASVFGAVLFGLVYLRYFLPAFSIGFIVLLAIASNVSGQLGDLCESAMKRGAGIKDSGNLLPGHGGILDRMDSSLFSLPTVYAIYLLRHLTSL